MPVVMHLCATCGEQTASPQEECRPCAMARVIEERVRDEASGLCPMCGDQTPCACSPDPDPGMP